MTIKQNRQPNNQQGNLLSRISKGNQTANNNQGTGANNQNNNSTAHSRLTNNNGQQSPKPIWTITPIGTAGVKFSYQGLGDPLFRILKTPLDKSFKDVDVFVNKLTESEELHQQLIEKLDDAWDNYGFSGATLMYPVGKTIVEAFKFPVMPIAQPDESQQSNTQNADNNNQAQVPTWLQPQNAPPPYEMYRAVDAMFVLNVLGRVRGMTLVEGTPLALEAGFLNQSYICDDPRIAELALATGAIEEIW